MSDLTITTNGHARELQAWIDLPETVRYDFDYVVKVDPNDPPAALPDDAYTTRFFVYRGSWYDANEFSAILRVTDYPGAFFTGLTVSPDSPLATWHGCQTESAFSAVLIRYPSDDAYGTDFSAVIVAHAHW